MKSINIKDIMTNSSVRDDGSEVALQLMKIIYDSDIKIETATSEKGDYKVTATPEINEFQIVINDEEHLAKSFLDEIIYRLDDKKLLNRFRFKINSDQILEKFQSISSNRNVPIKINWANQELTLNPSDEPSKDKPEIIYKDL